MAALGPQGPEPPASPANARVLLALSGSRRVIWSGSSHPTSSGQDRVTRFTTLSARPDRDAISYGSGEIYPNIELVLLLGVCGTPEAVLLKEGGSCEVSWEEGPAGGAGLLARRVAPAAAATPPPGWRTLRAAPPSPHDY